MFKKVEKINSVKAFQVENHLCYLHSNKGIVCSNGFAFESDSSCSLYLIQNKLFKQSYRGELQIYDVEQKELLFMNNKDEHKLFILPGFIERNDSIYATQINGNKEEFGLYNFKSKTFLSKIKSVGTIVQQLSIGLNYGGSSSSIEAVSLPDGKLLWVFNASQKYQHSGQDQPEEVSHFLGTYELELWFVLSSGKLIALSAETGELIHELNEREQGEMYTPLVQFDKNQIIGLRGKCYLNIDLKNEKPQRVYTDVSLSMTAHTIESSYRNQLFPYDDDFIYFCDDRQGKIGAFDRKGLKVVWSYQLETEHEGIAQILEMKYAKDHWYVLDRHHILHIFERMQ